MLPQSVGCLPIGRRQGRDIAREGAQAAYPVPGGRQPELPARLCQITVAAIRDIVDGVDLGQHLVRQQVAAFLQYRFAFPDQVALGPPLEQIGLRGGLLSHVAGVGCVPRSGLALPRRFHTPSH